MPLSYYGDERDNRLGQVLTKEEPKTQLELANEFARMLCGVKPVETRRTATEIMMQKETIEMWAMMHLPAPVQTGLYRMVIMNPGTGNVKARVVSVEHGGKIRWVLDRIEHETLTLI